MIDLLVFGIYRFFIMPLAMALLQLVRPFAKGKFRTMIEERRTPQRPALLARPIWIHAASGEIEYAKPVIRALKEKYPHIPILVTYFSPSAHRLVKSVDGIDAFVPAPWDHRKQVERFLQYANPLAVLFARTDVWPEMAFQLKNRKIPTVLFSATLAHNSSRKYGLARFLNRFALSALDSIYCVNAEDEREFRALGVSCPLKVLGDTRFDQVQYRLTHPKELRQLLPNLPSSQVKILVAGSTWPQDDKVLLEGLAEFIRGGNKVVWAPHEVHADRLQTLESQLHKRGWKSCRYTVASEWDSQTPILLLDQIGILPEIYTLGDLAFVGGSFKDRVHSVMEPLAAGLPVFVGPYHENNREALHFSLKALPESSGSNLNIVMPAKDAEELSTKISLLLSNPHFPNYRKFIQNEIRKMSGVTNQIVSVIIL